MTLLNLTCNVCPLILVVLSLQKECSLAWMHKIVPKRHAKQTSRRRQSILLSQQHQQIPFDGIRLFCDSSSENPSTIPILLETDTLLVIEKPVGISHANSDDELGILNLVRQQQQRQTGGTEYTGRIYGVHRLDRVTSGILVLAKDAATASYLAAAFRNGLVTKYYTGVSRHKATTKKQGWVTGDMVRGRRKSWQLIRNNASGGNIGTRSNYAKTRFFTAGLGGLTDCLADKHQEMQPKTLLLFRPITGRTHQLRVAAKSVGLPLAGDPTYSDGYPNESAQRTYLHATGFHLPAADGREAVTVWSPPPFHHLWSETARGDFEAILDKLVLKHCDCCPILETIDSL